MPTTPARKGKTGKYDPSDLFDFTESIRVEAPLPKVWEVLSDIETWWPASNPEHESLERLDDRGIEVGARIRIREKIAGIPGEAIGTIIRVDPLSAVTWEAPDTRYRWFGIPVTVRERVTWSVEPDGNATWVSAHVWAQLPNGIGRRLLEWVFTRPLRGVEKDREHTRTELRYLKQLIETDPNSHTT